MIEESIKKILLEIEEDAALDGNGELREGLRNTPKRVVESWKELYSGYKKDPKKTLDATFNGEGYDGIVLANSKKGNVLNLTTRDIYLALAEKVPANEDGSKLQDNPYKTWKDVNSNLPNIKIEVLGPPPTSGTRDAFVELAMDKGAKSFSALKELRGSSKAGKSEFKKIARTMREDGAFIEAGENDNLIVQKLDSNPNAIGIFGYSFLDQNSDKLQGANVNGFSPDFEKILSGEYAISRSLYVYVKKNHIRIKPSIVDFIKEFTSSNAMGTYGYLSEKGLIPLPADEYMTVKTNSRNLVELEL